MTEPSFPSEDWGLLDYEEAFTRQRLYVEKRLSNTIPDTLVFTEHPPVYTLGAHPKGEEHLLWEASKRKIHGIALHKTNRGGDVTYHGPGQIVGYPIIQLKRPDLHEYLRNLEEILIQVLCKFDLKAHRRTNKTGIWLETRKIAAIGVAVKRWVTYHGFALNVNNDLTPFQGIVPCGISPEEGTVTSMQKELGYSVNRKEVQALITTTFGKIFTPSHNE